MLLIDNSLAEICELFSKYYLKENVAQGSRTEYWSLVQVTEILCCKQQSYAEKSVLLDCWKLALKVSSDVLTYLHKNINNVDSFYHVVYDGLLYTYA